MPIELIVPKNTAPEDLAFLLCARLTKNQISAKVYSYYVNYNLYELHKDEQSR